MSTARIDAAIRRAALLHPGDRVLCALSGGADSVCLTHALSRLQEELQIEVRAAHFSHGIRLGAAESEGQLCQNLCDSLGIRLYTGVGDTPAHAAQSKLGIEEAARDLRYGFLRKAALEWGREVGLNPLAVIRGGVLIATGHNMEDQAETVLMNLIRGTGLQGLRGMEPRSGWRIRPLLAVPRAVIEGYVAENGLDYATDASNSDNTYTRNKIRNQIMPLVREINPKASRTMARGAALAGQNLDYITAQARLLMAELPSPHDLTTVFSARELARAHPAVAGRAVLMACEKHRLRVGRRHVDAVLAMARSEDPSARIDLPHLGVARREYDKLFIEPVERVQGWLAADLGAKAVELHLGRTVHWAGWEITASLEPLEDAWLFHREAVAFPLTVRQRQAGDRICLGKHHKTLKKWMIERKIPKNTRDIVPVLWDNKGVLCVGTLGADQSRVAARFEAGETVSVRVRPPAQTELWEGVEA